MDTVSIACFNINNLLTGRVTDHSTYYLRNVCPNRFWVRYSLLLLVSTKISPSYQDAFYSDGWCHTIQLLFGIMARIYTGRCRRVRETSRGFQKSKYVGAFGNASNFPFDIPV